MGDEVKRGGLETVTALLLAAVWVWIGYLKLSLGGWMLAVALLETSVGVGLVMPGVRRISGVLSLVLSVAFIGVTTFRWVALDIHGGCGCFGSWEPALRAHFMILGGIGLASCVLLVDSKRSWAAEGLP